MSYFKKKSLLFSVKTSRNVLKNVHNSRKSILKKIYLKLKIKSEKPIC